MHGYFGFQKRPAGIISPSFGYAILFSLVGLAISAAVLVMTAPPAFDEILARLE